MSQSREFRVSRVLCVLVIAVVASAPAAWGAQSRRPPHAQADRFYSYENDQGIQVIDDHVPPAFVHKGYTVLNANGRVVEVVPRGMSEEELRSGNPEVARKRILAEQQERQRREDEKLLERYSSVADIEAAEKRRIAEVRVRLENLRAEVAAAEEQVGARQAEAATHERNDEEVPAELTATIAALREQIAVAEQQMDERRKEITTLEVRFQMEIERFKVLRPEQKSPE